MGKIGVLEVSGSVSIKHLRKLKTTHGEEVIFVVPRVYYNEGEDLSIYSKTHGRVIGPKTLAQYPCIEICKSDKTTMDVVVKTVFEYLYHREILKSHEEMVEIYNRIIRNGGLLAYASKLESAIDKADCI